MFAAVLASAIVSSPAKAGALSSGNKAYNQGDTVRAVKKWSQSSHPEASYRIATLAEDGKIQDCDPIHCAASWYMKAAQGGHILSLTRVAVLNINNGYKAEGVSQLELAARWNDRLARNLLSGMGHPIPDPDLYNQAVEQERARQYAAELTRQQQQGQVAQMLGYLIGCGFGSACALSSSTAAAVPTSPSVASLPQTYISPNRPSAAKVINGPYPPLLAPPGRYVGGSGAITMCADGSYVAGSCRLAPNGQYVGGTPQMAPDGTYVSGTPRLAPNGRYVGGSGTITMCADGSYVSGSCRLTANGQHVGQ